MKKVVSILLTLAMMATMMSITFASGGTGFPVSIGAASAPGGMGTAVAKILGIIQWVGYAFALGMLIFIGIKYVMYEIPEYKLPPKYLSVAVTSDLSIFVPIN